MNRSLKTAAAALLLTSSATTAWAAGAVCAKPDDLSALQAIAVQQELMVSGLSCEALPQYNQFQTTFQTELRAQDRALMQFMRRINGAKGEAEYHAFKTRAANTAQLRYIHDPVGFCATTKDSFANALAEGAKPTLAVFVAARPIEDASTYESCDIRLAGGTAPDAPASIPVPLPKPVETVSAAQGSGLRPGN